MDLYDEEVTFDDGENHVAVTDDLPADFPGDVPLVDGRVSQGSAVTTGDSVGWSVVILHDADVEDTLDRVAAGLADAGLTETSRIGAQDGAILGYTSAAYIVQAVLSPQDGDTLVSYTVAKANPTP